MRPFTVFLYLSFLVSSLNPLTAAVDRKTSHDINGADDTELKTYIVHVRHPTGPNNLVHHPEAMEPWYYSLLEKSGIGNPAPGTTLPRIVHSYSHAMIGFAARLTPSELTTLTKTDWFIHAYPNRVSQLQTTHSPQFLGLQTPTGLWNRTNFGQGMIIGLIDSGIDFTHPSFHDADMPPPPSRWKGKCEPPVKCNNKLIGARSFVAGEPPTDMNGHGTHTASTAAGAAIKNASIAGQATGTAVGIAPRAHLSVYKICIDKDTCHDADLLAAIGAAIRDGCDVLSISVSDGYDGIPFYDSAIAVGTFSAVRRGIFVSASAGNKGPVPSTVKNDMPWGLTVAASTMDRKIVAMVKLGDGREFVGEALKQFKDIGSSMWPLVYPGKSDNPNFKYCTPSMTIDPELKGKVVLCEIPVDHPDQPSKATSVRGNEHSTYTDNQILLAGVIIMNSITQGCTTDVLYDVSSTVGFADVEKIQTYINSTADPTATVDFKGTILGSPRAPVVASFSSRGPSRASPGILKPDIAGPGVSVLAARAAKEGDGGLHTFMFDSGTSMACPHLSGIAAMVKAAHPEWSPAAIKSAIMTTSSRMDNKGGPILDERLLPADVFALGSGHVDASRAHDPGLVYDIEHHHYENYLCGLGYNENQIHAIVNRTVNCSTMSEQELNYPSISLSLGSEGSNFTVRRKVTNVGEAMSWYHAEVDAPVGVKVNVKPAIIKFKRLGQRKVFKVTFQRTAGGFGYVEGQLKWVSDRHVVRSPISIKLS